MKLLKQLLFTLALADLYPAQPVIMELQEDGSTKIKNIEKCTEKKIAIIGAGVGGTAASYWLSKNDEQGNRNDDDNNSCVNNINKKLVVYERSSIVGGRTATKDFHGIRIELGASIFHKLNTNMMGWTKEFGLNISAGQAGEDDDSLGVWDHEAKTMNFQTSRYKAITIAKTLWRYGMSPMTVEKDAHSFANQFAKLYNISAFNNIYDVLKETLLLDLTLRKGSEFFDNVLKVSKLYSREIISGITRNTYGQDITQMHALAVEVSAIGSDGDLFAVEGGNWQVPKHLVEASSADLRMETTVASLEKNDDNRITIKATDGTSEVFDAVIIATPLENANIDISSLDPPSSSTGSSSSERKYIERDFRTTHTTLVLGQLNPAYFNFHSEAQLPGNILTIEPENDQSKYFSCLSFHGYKMDKDGNAIKDVHNEKQPIYKFFSRDTLTDTMLNELFSSWTDVYRHHWSHAYPNLHPDPRFSSVLLAENVVYVNAFESVISCMECSSVASHNAVRLMSRPSKVQRRAVKHLSDRYLLTYYLIIMILVSLFIVLYMTIGTPEPYTEILSEVNTGTHILTEYICCFSNCLCRFPIDVGRVRYLSCYLDSKYT